MDEALVPGYRVLQIIGQGGQAKVYLAQRHTDGLQVALKILDRKVRQDQVYLERLRREYKLIAAIENEYVARIYDQSFTGDNPYIAMEFVPSGTLAGHMRGGMDSRDALRIISQVARALDAIHAKGIVHRDLKPANILFRADGRPVIVDFGLAKDLAVHTTLTVAGQLLTTPRYMSPEQCLGVPVDARSDLYSLGVIFYEMLTGQKIFDSAPPIAVINMHVDAPVPRLPERLAGYQPVLDRLLAKKPKDRFQSARELLGLIAILTAKSSSISIFSPNCSSGARARPTAPAPARFRCLAASCASSWTRPSRC
jgi:serine/threonine-protein kinase PpkA